ncbi:hypothetical protein GGR89_004454, partial [Sphingomonas trueperi]|nr:hypothetical protein [Sphingomonas trueperi]
MRPNMTLSLVGATVAEPTTLVRELAHPLADSIVLPAKRLILPR